MIQQTIYDNSIDQWIIIEPKRLLQRFIADERSKWAADKEYSYINPDNTNNVELFLTEMQAQFNTAVNASDWNTAFNLMKFPNPFFPMQYNGVHSSLVPFNLNESYTDIFLINLSSNSFTNFSNVNTKITGNTIYQVGDSNPKIVNLYQGVQAVRIPANAFYSNNLPVYGTYLVLLRPKFIETTVTSINDSIVGAEFSEINAQLQSTGLNRNAKSLVVNKTPFLTDTIWNFSTGLSGTKSQANGLLTDSIVEVYRGNNFITQKNILSDNLNLNITSDNISNIQLGTGQVGWDSSSESIAVGDTLRIYPRWTHFENIDINVTFTQLATSVNSVLRFLQNDTVRDVTTGIVSVYDSNGITIDSQGNINGTVIQQYQVTNTGSLEFRKNILLTQ